MRCYPLLFILSFTCLVLASTQAQTDPASLEQLEKKVKALELEWNQAKRQLENKRDLQEFVQTSLESLGPNPSAKQSLKLDEALQQRSSDAIEAKRKVEAVEQALNQARIQLAEKARIPEITEAFGIRLGAPWPDTVSIKAKQEADGGLRSITFSPPTPLSQRHPGQYEALITHDSDIVMKLTAAFYIPDLLTEKKTPSIPKPGKTFFDEVLRQLKKKYRYGVEVKRMDARQSSWKWKRSQDSSRSIQLNATHDPALPSWVVITYEDQRYLEHMDQEKTEHQINPSAL